MCFFAVPYCVYLSQSQELRCNCQDLEFNRSQPTAFPNNDFHVIHQVNDVPFGIKDAATIKLYGCPRLHLKLDLTPLPDPFYRYFKTFTSYSIPGKKIQVKLPRSIAANTLVL